MSQQTELQMPSPCDGFATTGIEVRVLKRSPTALAAHWTSWKTTNAWSFANPMDTSSLPPGTYQFDLSHRGEKTHLPFEPNRSTLYNVLSVIECTHGPSGWAMPDAVYSEITAPKESKAPMSKDDTATHIATVFKGTVNDLTDSVQQLMPLSLPGVSQIEIRLTRNRKDIDPFWVTIAPEGTSFTTAPLSYELDTSGLL